MTNTIHMPKPTHVVGILYIMYMCTYTYVQYITTVEPVYTNHPGNQENVVSVDRWSSVTAANS